MWYNVDLHFMLLSVVGRTIHRSQTDAYKEDWTVWHGRTKRKNTVSWVIITAPNTCVNPPATWLGTCLCILPTCILFSKLKLTIFQLLVYVQHVSVTLHLCICPQCSSLTRTRNKHTFFENKLHASRDIDIIYVFDASI